MKLSDLHREALADESGGDFEFGWAPPEGATLTVEVIMANSGQTSNGYPKWGVFLKVLSGEHEGQAFWDNIYLSANAGANKRSFAKMAEAGLGDTFFAADPSADAVATAFKGKRFTVKAGYRKNDKDPSRPWPNHKWMAADGDAPAPQAGGSDGTPRRW